MEFEPTEIPDVIQIKPSLFVDIRGFFMETYEQKKFAANGIVDPFVQNNQSGSRRGTLRGLHYQITQPQGKLIGVIVGEVYDVAVDLRPSSPTFGRWVGRYLSGENRVRLWVPKGFAHGFYVTSDWAEVVYSVTDFYAPEAERTLLWNDLDVRVNWPVDGAEPLLSPKDRNGVPLKRAEVFE